MSGDYSAFVYSFCSYVSQRARQWHEHGLGTTPAALQSLEQWSLRSTDMGRAMLQLQAQEPPEIGHGSADLREALERAASEVATLTLALRHNFERLNGSDATPPAGFEATIRCVDALRIALTDLRGGLPQEGIAPGEAADTDLPGRIADAS